MAEYPITATQKPARGFFRRSNVSRTLSTSSESEASSSSSSSSSRSDSDDDGFESTISTVSSLSRERRSISSTPSQSRTSSIVVPPSKRAHLKLSLAVIRARQALASQSWDQLASALRAIQTALPHDLTTLGFFIPILARLADDLTDEMSAEQVTREQRRSISKEDAKAYIALKQKWTGSGKGKARETDADWASQVRQQLSSRPLPVTKPIEPRDKALLTTIESLLLPSSLPRINLSRLNLTSDALRTWLGGSKFTDIVRFYLSFDAEANVDVRLRIVLHSVRSLDLSHNKLEALPPNLLQLFPNLETLSLSHNEFRHLPPEILLLNHLRRLRTHGNKLSKGHTRKIGTRHNLRDVQQQIRDKRAAAVDSDLGSLPSLVSHAVRRAQAVPPSIATRAPPDTVPPHLLDLVRSSYECYGCKRFILSASPSALPPLFERVHHLDPGVAVPTQIGYASSASDTTAHFSRTASKPPHLLTLEERVLLAVIGRGLDLTTFVIGGDHYRFCVKCASSHLAFDQGTCDCLVCEEERRVKGQGRTGEGDSVMRWLRRKPLRRIG